MEVTPQNIYKITDCTVAELTEGLWVPEWMKIRWVQLYEYYKWLATFRWTGDDELGRLLGGTLLGQINNNIVQWKSTSHKDLPKMNIFSAHDSTLLSLSTSLDINIEFPNFSACIMIELHQDNDEKYSVEMYYRNTHTDEVIPLKLKKCEQKCPLEDFLRLTTPRTTQDRSKICGLKTDSNTTTIMTTSMTHQGFQRLYNMEALVVGLGMLSLFLLLILLHFVINRSRFGEKYKMMDVSA